MQKITEQEKEYIRVTIQNAMRECAEKILKEHGEKCETYKTAEAYLKERNDIEQHSTMDEQGEFDLKTEDKLEVLRNEFLKSL